MGNDRRGRRWCSCRSPHDRDAQRGGRPVGATGLVLDDHDDQWLNVSRFGPPIDLAQVRLNDICLCEIEKGAGGRCYLVSLRVLPLDGPTESEADAKTHGAPETEHMGAERAER